jgi:hypothetical protein
VLIEMREAKMSGNSISLNLLYGLRILPSFGSSIPSQHGYRIGHCFGVIPPMQPNGGVLL